MTKNTPSGFKIVGTYINSKWVVYESGDQLKVERFKVARNEEIPLNRPKKYGTREEVCQFISEETGEAYDKVMKDILTLLGEEHHLIVSIFGLSLARLAFYPILEL